MSEHEAATTLALRGISKMYTVRMVQYFLDAACGDFDQKRYNFLYLPRRGHSHAGLAIVNFIDSHSCAVCKSRLRVLQSAMSCIKSVGFSYIQGFVPNLAYYAALVSEDARDASHVLVLENGQPADINRMIRLYVTPAMMQWAMRQAEALYRSADKGTDQDLRTHGEASEEPAGPRSATSAGTALTCGGLPRARLASDEEAEQIRRYFRVQTADFLIFSL